MCPAAVGPPQAADVRLLTVLLLLLAGPGTGQIAGQDHAPSPSPLADVQ